MIKVGSKVRDSITKFTGIAVTRTEHLFGCVHIGVTAESLDKDGKPLPTHIFDEQRIEVLEEKPPVVSKSSSAPTGCIYDPADICHV